MVQYALIMLHVMQFVLLPIGALSFLLSDRQRIPLDGNSSWWWVLLLGVVTGLFTSLTYAFQIGFFEAEHVAPKLFVDRRQTRQFLSMVLAPLCWIVAAGLLGWGTPLDAIREAGVLVLVGHHLVLSLLQGVEVGKALRDEPFDLWAIPVVLWRVVVTGLLLCVCAMSVWIWSSSLTWTWTVVFAGSLAAELSGSVPFYRAHVARIFPDD